MKNERMEEQEKLEQLNHKFLEEIESGKDWQQVQPIIHDMKDLAKGLEHIPVGADVITAAVAK